MGSFLLTLRRPFVADHFHDLPGFVEARHGHNWEIAATVRLRQEDEEPSFADALGGWVKGVDYTLLNEKPWLLGRNPTAELLGEWAFQHLESQGLEPVCVRIREKANYWAQVKNAPRPRQGVA